ncbi:6-carboxytetrahydropterin synthase QueD [Desulfohalobium retbaense]|uniref:6-carboxy-5,6,7,8-tetrahydropterin synthase n=1 Tax=Desulfohalobium retbaense (strain ATCC 49708 / DSM 5692 / JCM 16813 / HR100) TaxID=485915 RepID=C8X2N5_DESRD|nr:6-carboxytetrahydropterin synthase QueD [Desulfohalobium retbaense]ACV68682.1 6-pyruvoyl tetrahydropterin synthase and hypothetical protein [Desulfohalobium retbaense DSM 5692]
MHTDQGLYRLRVRGGFSASHQLLHYEGKCERLHGHNFRVEAEVEGREVDPDTGMLLDFKVLKKRLNAVLDYLDHRHLNELTPFEGLSPSSENIARYIFTTLQKSMAEPGVRLREVSVAENEGSVAVYREE